MAMKQLFSRKKQKKHLGEALGGLANPDLLLLPVRYPSVSDKLLSLTDLSTFFFFFVLFVGTLNFDLMSGFRSVYYC